MKNIYNLIKRYRSGCFPKKTYYTLIFAISILIPAAFPAFSQSILFYGADTSNYPKMKAKLLVTDNKGNPVSNLSSSDIVLKEDGVQHPVSLSCPELKPPVNLSMVLTIDASGSMSKDARLTKAKRAATALINAMPAGRCEAAITCFNDANLLIKDFTTNKQRLLEGLKLLDAGGGTSFDAGLISQPAGALVISEKAINKRVIVFLTDGESSGNEDAIVTKANLLKATIYCVTIALRTPDILRNVATRTGGKFYDMVTNGDQLTEIYLEILQEAQETKTCTVEWQADGCTLERSIQIDIPSWKLSSSLKYTAPLKKMSGYSYSPSNTIKFGGINPGNSDVQYIMLVSSFETAVITGITSTNNRFQVIDYGGMTLPVTLPPFDSLKVGIRFTPKDSGYIVSKFEIKSNICFDFNFYATGGFPGVAPGEPTLEIIEPKGKETWFAGRDTIIRWDGVLPEDKVTLSFSSDKGSNWSVITDTATGLSWPWHVPIISSDQCLMRVKQNNPFLNKGWLAFVQGDKTDLAGKMAVDPYGSVILSGYFSGMVSFGGGTSLTSYTETDQFFAKYLPNGNCMWARQIYGSPQNRISAVASDSAGNIYLAGTYRLTTTFGNNFSSTSKGEADLFVAKYNSDGECAWAFTAGSHGDDEVLSLYLDKNKNVYLTGYFADTLDMGNSIVLTSPYLIRDLLVARLDSNGKCVWANRAGSAGHALTVGYSISVDSADNAYTTGRFGYLTGFGNGIYLNNNTEAMFLAKYNNAGICQWAVKAGGPKPTVNSAQGYRLRFSHKNEILVAGTFIRQIDFTKNTSFIDSNGYSPHLFVARYNGDGDFISARQTGIITFDYYSGDDMFIDREANLFFTGKFKDTLDLDSNFRLANANYPSYDIYTAKFGWDKGYEWLNTYGGPSHDGSQCILIGEDSSLYLSGFFSADCNFGNDTYGHSKGETDGFLMKLQGNKYKYQEDVSDTLWKIVQLKAEGHDIDLGACFNGKQKDSVITGYIVNTGDYAITIDSIKITGQNTSDFKLISGLPPFEVPFGGASDVEFRFQPSAKGIRSADVDIFTRSFKMTYKITGRSVEKEIFSTELIDFGRVWINEWKDTTVAIIKYSGIDSIIVSETKLLGPDSVQFRIIGGGGSFVLKKNEEHEIMLEFFPKDTGRTSCLLAFYHNQLGSPAFSQLFGEGYEDIGSTLIMPGIVEAKSGDFVDIPILISNPSFMKESRATGFTTKLRFNATLLVPVGSTPRGTIVSGVREIPLALPAEPIRDSTIGMFRFQTTLGNAESTDLVLAETAPVGGKVRITEVPGEFRLSDICKEGGARLIFNTGQLALSSCIPNPANGKISFGYSIIDIASAEIVITDIFGDEIMIIKNDTHKPGAYEAVFDVSGLNSGTYYCLLKTMSGTISRKFSVIK